MNWPVELSYPTCVTCTGFSGAEMTGFLGDPTSVLMRPEKPDFFLKTPGLGSFVSSEYLLGPVNWLSPTRGPCWAFSDNGMAMGDSREKLVEWRSC